MEDGHSDGQIVQEHVISILLLNHLSKRLPPRATPPMRKHPPQNATQEVSKVRTSVGVRRTQIRGSRQPALVLERRCGQSEQRWRHAAAMAVTETHSDHVQLKLPTAPMTILRPLYQW